MKRFIRQIALFLILMLSLTTYASAESAYVKKNITVYADASGNRKLGELSKHAVVTVSSRSGSFAKIKYKGKSAYAKAANLVSIEETTDAVKVSKATRFYKKSSLKGSYKSLRKGTTVNLISISGQRAMIEWNGNIGYTKKAHLSAAASSTGSTSPAPSAPSAPTPTTTPAGSATTFNQAVTSGKYSNEELIFLFLTKVADLNTAAACGILSNIYSESGFRPTAYNSGGGSYGICQWTGGRYTRLKNFCAERGYDYTSVKGQLYYLEYELKNNYSKVLKNIQNVENTAAGAYDAAYSFCYNFEVPANRASVSIKRGNHARDAYWPKYNK